MGAEANNPTTDVNRHSETFDRLSLTDSLATLISHVFRLHHGEFDLSAAFLSQDTDVAVS
jgi:hypothetical protein